MRLSYRLFSKLFFLVTGISDHGEAILPLKVTSSHLRTPVSRVHVVGPADAVHETLKDAGRDVGFFAGSMGSLAMTGCPDRLVMICGLNACRDGLPFGGTLLRGGLEWLAELGLKSNRAGGRAGEEKMVWRRTGCVE